MSLRRFLRKARSPSAEAVQRRALLPSTSMGLSLSTAGAAVPNSREAVATLLDRQAQLLLRFSGAEAVPYGDPFW